MAVVKGSKHYRMKVVAYRPVFRTLLWMCTVLVVGAAIAASYWMGNFKGKEQQGLAVAERDKLRVEVVEKTKEAESLRQEAANLRLGLEVDRKANDGIREEVITLKAKIAELEEDISFYRGLMSPTGNKQGLTIGSLNVISTGAPRHYEYKLVVQQLATNHQVLSGFLTFNVVGRMGEAVQTVPLKELSAQIDSENIKLRFKYFQSIEGELVLPPGFEPERIELMAKSTGRHSATVEKKFGWLVQES